MLRTNKDHLVIQSVMGEIAHPRMQNPFLVGQDGIPQVLPGIGAITYNIGLGDLVFGWECDHVEPGVSIRNPDDIENTALLTLACIGNEAKVISGDGKGLMGFVTGAHAGRDNTILYFDKKELGNLSVGDKVQIKAFGLGLKLPDYSDIKMMSLDPDLLEAMQITEGNGCLEVPVVATVPAYLMGSGIGAGVSQKGDYDIMTQDRGTIERLGLNKLRFGDLVLLSDCDNTYGRGYLRGAVTVGVIVHSDCILAGHGPGVVTLMSSKEGNILPRIDEKANIGRYLGLW
ncbi:hypothetical protein CEB3_c49010 [Peptococcaceae bacterium CEB3]|nr:hypothetical protein CEB3_c49010 [Peptococcaceae bacterium CEB3]